MIKWKKDSKNVVWTAAGKKWMGTELENGKKLEKSDLLFAAHSIKLTATANTEKFPAAIALAFDSIIAEMQFKISSVVAVGHTNYLAPYCFYAVTYRYKDCDATSFWLDAGSMLTCMMSMKHGERLF